MDHISIIMDSSDEEDELSAYLKSTKMKKSGSGPSVEACVESVATKCVKKNMETDRSNASRASNQECQFDKPSFDSYFEFLQREEYGCDSKTTEQCNTVAENVSTTNCQQDNPKNATSTNFQEDLCDIKDELDINPNRNFLAVGDESKLGDPCIDSCSGEIDLKNELRISTEPAVTETSAYLTEHTSDATNTENVWGQVTSDSAEIQSCDISLEDVQRGNNTPSLVEDAEGNVPIEIQENRNAPETLVSNNNINYLFESNFESDTKDEDVKETDEVNEDCVKGKEEEVEEDCDTIVQAKQNNDNEGEDNRYVMIREKDWEAISKCLTQKCKNSTVECLRAKTLLSIATKLAKQVRFVNPAETLRRVNTKKTCKDSTKVHKTSTVSLKQALSKNDNRNIYKSVKHQTSSIKSRNSKPTGNLETNCLPGPPSVNAVTKNFPVKQLTDREIFPTCKPRPVESLPPVSFNKDHCADLKVMPGAVSRCSSAPGRFVRKNNKLVYERSLSATDTSQNNDLHAVLESCQTQLNMGESNHSETDLNNQLIAVPIGTSENMHVDTNKPGMVAPAHVNMRAKPLVPPANVANSQSPTQIVFVVGKSGELMSLDEFNKRKTEFQQQSLTEKPVDTSSQKILSSGKSNIPPMSNIKNADTCATNVAEKALSKKINKFTSIPTKNPQYQSKVMLESVSETSIGNIEATTCSSDNKKRKASVEIKENKANEKCDDKTDLNQVKKVLFSSEVHTCTGKERKTLPAPSPCKKGRQCNNQEINRQMTQTANPKRANLGKRKKVAAVTSDKSDKKQPQIEKPKPNRRKRKRKCSSESELCNNEENIVLVTESLKVDTDSHLPVKKRRLKSVIKQPSDTYDPSTNKKPVNNLQNKSRRAKEVNTEGQSKSDGFEKEKQTAKKSAVGTRLSSSEKKSTKNIVKSETENKDLNSSEVADIDGPGKKCLVRNRKSGEKNVKKSKEKVKFKMDTLIKEDSKEPKGKIKTYDGRNGERKQHTTKRGKQKHRNIDNSWKELLSEDEFRVDVDQLQNSPAKPMNVKKVIRHILKQKKGKTAAKKSQVKKSKELGDSDLKPVGSSDVSVAKCQEGTVSSNVDDCNEVDLTKNIGSMYCKQLTEQILSSLKERNHTGLHALKEVHKREGKLTKWNGCSVDKATNDLQHRKGNSHVQSNSGSSKTESKKPSKHDISHSVALEALPAVIDKPGAMEQYSSGIDGLSQKRSSGKDLAHNKKTVAVKNPVSIPVQVANKRQSSRTRTSKCKQKPESKEESVKSVSPKNPQVGESLKIQRKASPKKSEHKFSSDPCEIVSSPLAETVKQLKELLDRAVADRFMNNYQMS